MEPEIVTSSSTASPFTSVSFLRVAFSPAPQNRIEPSTHLSQHLQNRSWPLAMRFAELKVGLAFGGLRYSSYLCRYKRSRSGAVVARWAHNPKVTGSSPVSATNDRRIPHWECVFFCCPYAMVCAERGEEEWDSRCFRSLRTKAVR